MVIALKILYKVNKEVYNLLLSTMHPALWGREYWYFIHISASHADKRKSSQTAFRRFLVLLCDYLPCPMCRLHASRFIRSNNMSGRCFKYTVDLHNSVNKRLKIPVLTYAQARHYMERRLHRLPKGHYGVRMCRIMMFICTTSVYDNMEPQETQRLEELFRYYIRVAPIDMVYRNGDADIRRARALDVSMDFSSRDSAYHTVVLVLSAIRQCNSTVIRLRKQLMDDFGVRLLPGFIRNTYESYIERRALLRRIRDEDTIRRRKSRDMKIAYVITVFVFVATLTYTASRPYRRSARAVSVRAN